MLGEAEAAGRRRVVQAGVSERIDGVDDRPAEDHARDGEDRERDAKAAFGPPGLREHERDGDEARHARAKQQRLRSGRRTILRLRVGRRTSRVEPRHGAADRDEIDTRRGDPRNEQRDRPGSTCCERRQKRDRRGDRRCRSSTPRMMTAARPHEAAASGGTISTRPACSSTSCEVLSFTGSSSPCTPSSRRPARMVRPRRRLRGTTPS